jgi:hypothetical protein
VTGEQIVPVLAWFGLLVWLAALALFLKRHDSAAAVLHAGLALPLLFAPVPRLVKWAVDPGEYARHFGTAALTELPGYAALVGAAILSLIACLRVSRGRRTWIIVTGLINGASLAFWFYLAYFFRIF